MDIIHPLAEQYAAGFTSPDDTLLQELEDYTLANHPHAHMLSGRVQGQFLQLISRVMQPRRVLEVGTFTGYSALCLAAGLPADGQLYTLELRDTDADTARSFIARSHAAAQIQVLTGDARQLIPGLQENWDLVFIDADKTGYIDYYELILPSVRENGLVIADNLLFHGQVLENEVKGKNAQAIHAFNAHVRSDQRVQTVMLTVRDGLGLMRKKLRHEFS
jgi:predicted O-methyltransferase YrrM